MTDVIDGAVKLTEDDVAKLNEEQDVTQMDDAALQALADKSGDTVEHIKEMLKLHNTGEPAKTDDDKLLAGKYKTEGDLDQGIQSLIDKYGKEEAYKMLESQMGKSTEEIDANLQAEADAKAKADADAKAKADADALADGDVLSDDDAAAKAAAEAKAKADAGELDINKYAEEFAENEKLSDTSYEELAKAGLDKELVDSYITAIAAQAELYTGKVYKMAGGEEKYNALVQWGTENLTDPERVRFNDAVNSGDLAQAGLVLDAISARMEKADGTFKRIGVDVKDNVGGTGVVPYLSTEEMRRDMSDPRYKNGDTAFIKQVEAKMKVSNI